MFVCRTFTTINLTNYRIHVLAGSIFDILERAGLPHSLQYVNCTSAHLYSPVFIFNSYYVFLQLLCAAVPSFGHSSQHPVTLPNFIVLPSVFNINFQLPSGIFYVMMLRVPCCWPGTWCRIRGTITTQTLTAVGKG